MTLNLQKLYHDTPGKKNSIHLNNAGASLMSQQVLDTQISHLELEAAIGGYEAMAERKKEIADVHVSIAELIGANANEIAIVENATVGWAMAFYAIDFKPGDRILTVEAEYISNYMAYLHMARDKGVSIEVIPSGRDGNLCIDTLENMIDENVKLISATHIPTNSGLINAVSDIGKVAKKYNIYFLVDACQSVGQMPIDVDEIGCDMLSATGRKYLRGPRGVGFLYVRKSIIRKLHPPIIDLRSADWLNSNEYKLKEDGLGSAVDYALNLGLNNIQLRNTELASYLRTCLKKIDTVHIHAISDRQCAITSFYVQDQTASNIVNELRKNNINTSVSDPSSTLLDANKNKLPSLIRASVHYYNDKDEIDNFIKVLSSLI